MASKKISSGKIIIGAFAGLLLMIGSFIFGLKIQNNESVSVLGTSTGDAASVASAAYAKCVNNGGFVTTDRRGKNGFYNLCNFADDMNCELYALYNGQCPVGGVHIIGYSTKPQVFCALRGGTPQGSENGQCKMPNGKTCTTDSIYKGTCQYDN